MKLIPVSQSEQYSEAVSAISSQGGPIKVNNSSRNVLYNTNLISPQTTTGSKIRVLPISAIQTFQNKLLPHSHATSPKHLQDLFKNVRKGGTFSIRSND
jgi:hypothetical protein